MIFWLLLFSLTLRLISLNQSLWLDEAIQAWAASSFNLQTLLTKFSPTDVHPPLSYLVSRLSGQLLGFSETALRLPSVLFGLLTIYCLYQLAKTLKLKQPFIPPLLLTTSGLHIYYSQEVRMYSLACLLVTLSIFSLVKYLNKKSNLIPYTLFTALSLYAHYYTWLMLPAHWLIVYLKKPKTLKPFILSQLIFILAYLPWLPILLTQLQAGFQAAASQSQWASVVGGLNLKALALIPIKFLIGRISFDNNLIYAAVVSLPLILSLVLIAKAVKNKQPSFNLKLSLAWLAIPILLATLISFKLPVLSYHRFLFVLPAFYLLLSLGLDQLKPLPQKLFLTFFLIFNLFTSSCYLLNSSFHREDWQQLTRTLVNHNSDQAPVMIISVVSSPLNYYYAGPTLDFNQLDQISQSSHFYLIPYSQPIFYPDFNFNQITDLGFQENFKQHFRGNLTLIEYIK